MLRACCADTYPPLPCCLLERSAAYAEAPLCCCADIYAPAYLPGFPTASNINDTGFTLSVGLYKPAVVFYEVWPTSQVREGLAHSQFL